MAVTLASWDALGGNPPASNYAVFATVNNTPYLSFASGTTISEFFIGVIPQGAALSANGIKVRLYGGSHTATSGVAVLGAAYERFGTLTVASDHFGTEVTNNFTVPGTVDVNGEADISIPYANMASSVAGDMFRLNIRRITGGSDTLVGAFQLFGVTIETP
jgi:hypothetical protein